MSGEMIVVPDREDALAMTTQVHDMTARARLSRRDAVLAGGLGAAALLGSAGHPAGAQDATPATPAAAGATPAAEGAIVLRPLLSENEMWEAFGSSRALIYALDEGADFGECMVTIRQIGDGGVDDWHREWVATGNRVMALADEAAAAGQRVSARRAYYRATNYFHVAYLPLYGKPVDPRLVAAFDLEVEAFLKGAALSDFPVEPVEIPFEGTTLPGYLLLVDDSGAPRPTVVHTNGFDSTIQEMYFAHGPSAVDRGYNVLLFDGPGQGRPLIKQGMFLRPDWETVVTPVIDYALTRPEIDPARIALAGWSFGGYLAPRAACFEHRIAALVADPGQWDQRGPVLSALPLTEAQKTAFPDIDPALLDPMQAYLEGPDAPPMLQWAIVKRSFWTNDVDSLYGFAVDLLRYQLSPYAQNIACPTFLSQASDDPVAAYASDLYAAITQPKVLVPFTMAEGAGMHCEAMARTLYHQRMFAWLDQTLGVSR